MSEKLNKHGYPLIESEKQYWEEFKKWKKRFNKITWKQMKSNPYKYVEEIENLLNEAVDRDLLEKEYVDKKLNRLYKELQMPNKFKDDIQGGKRYLRKKAKELKQNFKRKKKDGEKS